jgi:hypothetical protein
MTSSQTRRVKRVRNHVSVTFRRTGAHVNKPRRRVGYASGPGLNFSPKSLPGDVRPYYTQVNIDILRVEKGQSLARAA